MLCFVDCASLYNLVNKAKLVHSFSCVCLFLFSTCFGRLCVHHQEKYRGADKSSARHTSPCILFDGENISSDVILVIYIYLQ